MKIGNPQLVLDPYEWLPGYGESKISFRSLGADVIIDVDYEKDASASDGKNEATLLCRREIAFKNARYFLSLLSLDLFFLSLKEIQINLTWAD